MHATPIALATAPTLPAHARKYLKNNFFCAQPYFRQLKIVGNGYKKKRKRENNNTIFIFFLIPIRKAHALARAAKATRAR